MNEKDFVEIWKGMYGPTLNKPDLPPMLDSLGKVTVTAVDRSTLTITIDIEPERSVTRLVGPLFGEPMRPRLPGVLAFASEAAHG